MSIASFRLVVLKIIFSLFVVLIIFQSKSSIISKKSESKNCNLYLSSRICRPCFVNVELKMKEFQVIDTLFLVTAKDDQLELDHFKKILAKTLIGKTVKDTIYMYFEGSVYSTNSKTNFADSSLNSLFNKSTPFIFSRSKNGDFDFFGT